MRSSKNLDLKRRAKFRQAESSYNVFLFTKKDLFLPKAWRAAAQESLGSRDSYATEIKNFCIRTYRCRGIVKTFKVSRHLFKKLASEGKIYGVRKASW